MNQKINEFPRNFIPPHSKKNADLISRIIKPSDRLRHIKRLTTVIIDIIPGQFQRDKNGPLPPVYQVHPFYSQSITGVSGITSKKSRKAYQNDGLAFCLL